MLIGIFVVLRIFRIEFSFCFWVVSLRGVSLKILCNSKIRIPIYIKFWYNIRCQMHRSRI